MHPKGYCCISAEKAKEMMDGGSDLIVLDVRTLAEFEQGHIPNALHLDYTHIIKDIHNIAPDKSTTLLLYCRSGIRSQIAALNLLDEGYSDVLDFGGILSWEYEIVK